MRLLLALFVALGAVGIIIVTALNVPSRQLDVEPLLHIHAFDEFDWNGAYERLAQSLTLKTVSYELSVVSYPENFLKLHDLFKHNYPLVHSRLTREVFNDYTLLYTWRGTDESQPAVILMSHLDIVPTPDASLDQWDYEPFAGHITDQFIYGRGAIDVKSGVLGILEAVEVLLKEDFKPKQTFFILFGHDEEVGGTHGAQVVARTLKQRGEKVDYVLDEGSAVVKGLIDNFDPEKEVALVAIAEKGFVSLELTANATGGHSSMPPSPSVIGTLAKAIIDLESHPFPIRDGTSKLTFDYLAPHFPPTLRVILSLPILRSLVYKTMSGSPQGNAQLRTTIAPTMLKGGIKANVLPPQATCVVNFRISPGDSIESVEEHVRSVVDKAITISRHAADHANEPAPLSPIDSFGFNTIHKTCKQVIPNVIVAPSITLGGTDARHMSILTENVYRFLPYTVGKNDLSRFHGINERISLSDYRRTIKFYYQLIRNSQDAS